MENQDDAEFESGYSTEPTETPVPAKEPVAKEAPKAVEAPVDPLVAVLARLDKFENTSNTLAGHIGGLQRSQKEISERLAAGNAATKQVTDAPTQAQVKEAMANPKEWDALKDDFPEWASATEKYMDAKLAGMQPQGMDDAAMEKILSTVEERVINTSLNAVFPGWKSEVATPEFGKWIASQSDDVKALADSSDVGDAARMLKLYGLSKQVKPVAKTPDPKPVVSAREKRLEAAVNPKGTGGHAAGRTEIDEFEAGYSST